MQTQTETVNPVPGAAKARVTRPYTRLTKEQRKEFFDWFFGEKKTVGTFAMKFGCSKQSLYSMVRTERRRRRANVVSS